jgi:IPT/TIG domain
MAGFTFNLIPAPMITSFTPLSVATASAGMTTMTINGTNFTGATAVSVGGVAVPFTVVSATRITTTLGGALSGAVSVTTPGGTATMAGFVVTVFAPFDGISSQPRTNALGDEQNAVTAVAGEDVYSLSVYPTSLF